MLHVELLLSSCREAVRNHPGPKRHKHAPSLHVDIGPYRLQAERTGRARSQEKSLPVNSAFPGRPAPADNPSLPAPPRPGPPLPVLGGVCVYPFYHLSYVSRSYPYTKGGFHVRVAKGPWKYGKHMRARDEGRRRKDNEHKLHL